MTIETLAARPLEADPDAEGWVSVCSLDDLPTERGAAALVGGRQVAIFRLLGDELAAICQRDPYSGAFVMSRGIVGSARGVPTVASPMYKHVFALRTGECLETHGAEARSVRVYPVRVVGDQVQVLAAVLP